MKKILIGALIILGGVLAAPHVQASSVNGGSGGGSSSVTSSSIASAGGLLGSNNLSDISNTSTAISNLGLGATNTVTFAYLNGLALFPSPNVIASGTLCGVTNGVTDVGTCFNDVYAAVASGTTVIVGPYTYPTSTWAVARNFSTNQKAMFISCTPNGTVFNWGGVGTSTFWNYGNAGSGAGYIFHTNGVGENGCTFVGTGAGGTSTFAVVGGTNGAEGWSDTYNRYVSWANVFTFSNNVYITNLNYNTFVGNCQNVEFPSGLSNSGERFNAIGNLFGDINCGATALTSSTIEHGVDLNGLVGPNICYNSIDDDGITIHGGVQGGNLCEDYMENPAVASNPNYPAYHYVTLTASTISNVNMTDFTVMQDATNTTSTVGAFFSSGAALNMSGVTAISNSSVTASTTKYLVVETATSSALTALGTANASGTGFSYLDQQAQTSTVGQQVPYASVGSSSPYVFSVSTGTINATVNIFTGIQAGIINFGAVSPGASDKFTFGKPFNFPPSCTMTDATGTAAPNIIRNQVITTTTDVFSDSVSLATSGAATFLCVGNPN